MSWPKHAIMTDGSRSNLWSNLWSQRLAFRCWAADSSASRCEKKQLNEANTLEYLDKLKNIRKGVNKIYITIYNSIYKYVCLDIHWPCINTTGTLPVRSTAATQRLRCWAPRTPVLLSSTHQYRQPASQLQMMTRTTVKNHMYTRYTYIDIYCI